MPTDGVAADPLRSQALETLAVADDLRRAVRGDRRHPALIGLLVMGVLFTAAGIVYRVFPGVPAQIVPGSGGGYRIPRDDPWLNLGGQPPHPVATWLWVLGIPTAWALCGWLFQRRRDGGLGSPGAVIAGLGILPFALLAFAELILAPRIGAVHAWLDDPGRQVMPAAAVAAGLALVALWERDVWLAMVAALFSAGPILVAGQFVWYTVDWGSELLNVNLAMLWWGLLMLVVAATWWIAHRIARAGRA